jgi:hypothetical protein
MNAYADAKTSVIEEIIVGIVLIIVDHGPPAFARCAMGGGQT